MSGNFGYTPSRMRNRKLGDFSVPAVVVPISDFCGFKRRAVNSGFGDIFDTITGTISQDVQAAGQQALDNIQSGVTSAVLNDPAVQAQAAASANKSAFQAFYDKWNSPAGQQQILLYAGLGVGAIFLASLVLGRASVGRR